MLEFLSQHLTLTLILAGVPLPNNWGNCQIAATLFQNQGGVKTQFWCEKGPYKK
jgi:hypothetical protein